MVRRGGHPPNSSRNDGAARKEGSNTSEEITRCICGNDEFVSTPRSKSMNASPGLYVQCERCNVWQHGFCMGFSTEKDIPNEYYCELCEPSFHRISNRHGVLLSKYRPFKATSDEPSKDGVSKVKAEEAVKPPDSIPENGNDDATSDPDSSPEANSKTPSKDVKNGKTSEARALTVEAYDNGEKEKPKIKAEEVEISASHQAAGVSNDQNKNMSDQSTNDDNRKRSRKAESEAQTLSRNRKRRSREDEILQRVLEESAREAREAEARRKSMEGGSQDEGEAAPANGHNTPDSQDDDDEEDEGVRAPRAKRTRTTAHSGSTAADAKRRDVTKTNVGGRAPRGGKSTRGGRRSAQRVSADRSPASPGSSTRRTANGVKKCKPRIPSQKATFDEMRRRVAFILDYSSRTQDELANEKHNGIGSLRRAANAVKFDGPINHLSQICDKNFSNLEELTRKLLQWEEQFGIKDSP